MNYRHAFHAGNAADVLKHVLLVALVRALQRKETGFLFVDTHAGRGRYDLQLAAEGSSKPRAPEWPAGIGRLWKVNEGPPAIMDYLAVVRGYDRTQGNLGVLPRFYPGSPRIVRAIGRTQDRLELWEKHPAECAALRDGFEDERRVSVHEADGYGALRACLPPRERRALVLIDPPFEDADEWSSVMAALGGGLERLPGGVFAVWYPLTERVGAEGFLESARSLRFPALAVEMVTDPKSKGMRGSGVLVVNPPWQFDGEAAAIAAYLAEALSAEGRGSMRWIVPR